MADDEPVLDRSFRGHKATVSCVAFSPTTRQLASGSADGACGRRLSCICFGPAAAPPPPSRAPRPAISADYQLHVGSERDGLEL
jgi:WD40 repeat protein